MVASPKILASSCEKDKFQPIQQKQTKFELHVLHSLLMIFLEKSFLGREHVVSLEIKKKSCMIQDLGNSCHGSHFDHILKGLWEIKKNQKNIKSSHCVMLCDLVSRKNDRLGQS